MSTLAELTDATFPAFIAQSTDRPVAVEFWAPWCTSCQALAPILTSLAAESADTIDIATVNVDQNPATADAYDVKSLPTILLFAQGKLVRTLTGMRPKPALQRAFAEATALTATDR